jgi:2,5-diketo-D-gluconate reductase A
VVLRWHVQRGDIVFPKSTTPARIEENFQIFDFELEPEDIAVISALDRGEEGRTGPNPDVLPMCRASKGSSWPSSFHPGANKA